MNIHSVTLSHLTIPLRVTFKHAQAERSVTESIWAQVTTDTHAIGHGEACPRSYVTGESIDGARAFFREHVDSIVQNIHDLASLTAWAERQRAVIDRNPAAWCALELALLEALAISARQSVAELLGLSCATAPQGYTAVVGDGGHDFVAAIVAQYRDLELTDFKIKLSGDSRRDIDKLEQVRTLCGSTVRARADANNLFSDTESAIRGLRPLKGQLWAIEEPARPRDYAAMRAIGDALGVRIILDESVCARDDLAALTRDPQRWIVNLRVSKMGGLLRSLELARLAQTGGLDLIVGAQVGETSVLTRAATLVGTGQPSGVLAREGAFGKLLLRDDVCTPPLMFGKRGLLADAATSTTGWQLNLRPDAAYLRVLEST